MTGLENITRKQLKQILVLIACALVISFVALSLEKKFDSSTNQEQLAEKKSKREANNGINFSIMTMTVSLLVSVTYGL